MSDEARREALKALDEFVRLVFHQDSTPEELNGLIAVIRAALEQPDNAGADALDFSFDLYNMIRSLFGNADYSAWGDVKTYHIPEKDYRKLQDDFKSAFESRNLLRAKPIDIPACLSDLEAAKNFIGSIVAVRGYGEEEHLGLCRVIKALEGNECARGAEKPTGAQE
jgi:hypothetical protein